LFDPQDREHMKARHAIRACKALGSGDAFGELVFALDLSQLITQARSFGAILLRRDMVLDGANAPHRVENLDESIVLAFARMF
jgi:hypothetical protein